MVAVTKPMDNVHPVPVDWQRSTVVDSPAGVPALSEVEALAATALVAGCPVRFAEHVRHRAAALAGPGGPEVRSRSISKALALAEAQLSQLSALLAQAVARRDVEAVNLLDRAATGATRRLAVLLDQHRAEETKGHRPVVVIGAAGQVNVGDGR